MKQRTMYTVMIDPARTSMIGGALPEGAFVHAYFREGEEGEASVDDLERLVLALATAQKRPSDFIIDVGLFTGANINNIHHERGTPMPFIGAQLQQRFWVAWAKTV